MRTRSPRPFCEHVPAMQTIVGAIVDVARTSPLTSLGELRRALDDPNAVIGL